MRRRTLTIALAGMLALIGVVAVLTYARQANNRAIAGMKAENVYQATGTIPTGMSLLTASEKGLLKTIKVPVISLSAEPVNRVTAANEHLVLNASLATDELLTQNMLVSKASVAASSAVTLPIPLGDVAVTVQMCVQEAVADYITAGSDVAVFDTYVTGKASVAQRTCDVTHQGIPPVLMATRIVLTRASVLAVGASPAAAGTSAGNASTVTDPTSSSVQGSVLVTLAVDQADAERLISIDELGLPYMALLTPDSKTSFDNPANPTNLFQP